MGYVWYLQSIRTTSRFYLYFKAFFLKSILIILEKTDEEDEGLDGEEKLDRLDRPQTGSKTVGKSNTEMSLGDSMAQQTGVSTFEDDISVKTNLGLFIFYYTSILSLILIRRK